MSQTQPAFEKKELYYYQNEAVECTIDYVSADPRKRKGSRPVIVLPTASGKSLVIAELARRGVIRGKRVLLLTHRAELVQQDVEEFVQVTGGSIKHGIYSASLKNKDLSGRVTFANVQSLVRAEDIPFFEFVITDEAHWVPPLVHGKGKKSQYQKVFEAINAQGPMILAGLSASPYRLGTGYIWEGPDAAFDGVSYTADMRRLELENYLSPLVSYNVGDASLDTSKVRVKAGEFVEADLEELTEESAEIITDDIVRRAQRTNRRSVKVFVPGVRMARVFADLLRNLDPTGGVDIILGETTREERDKNLSSFRAGKSRYLVSCAVLTTGLNVPRIDAVALVRATKSAALYVQMAGRGSRLFENKTECLIWDYGENVQRHGPVNCVTPDKSGGSRTDPAGKFCKACDAANPRGQDICVVCGEPFPPPQERAGPVVSLTPSKMKIIDDELDLLEWVNVQQVTSTPHESKAGNICLRVLFRIEPNARNGTLPAEVSEFLQPGISLQRDRFLRITGVEMPNELEQAMNIVESTGHRIKSAGLKKDGRFWKVEQMQTWAESWKEIYPGEDTALTTDA